MTLCACGCGQEIIFKTHHKYRDIKYINGHSNIGRKRPDLSRRNKNKKMYGENNPFYGKHHTEENKQKQREKMLGRYDGENNPNSKEKIKKYVNVVKLNLKYVHI